MHIKINGKTEKTTATTLAELITELGLKEESLVVEHNHQIMRQERWASSPLQENDVLELLNFVGGG